MSGDIRRPGLRGQRTRQRGVAALAVALIIIVVATVVTLGVAQVGVADQKGMANELRNREAGSAAELGLERGVVYLRQNKRVAASTSTTAPLGWLSSSWTSNASNPRWTLCADSTVSVPCGNGKVNLFGDDWTAFANVNNLGNSGESLSGSFTVHYVTRSAMAGSVRPGSGPFYVVAEGRSRDGSGVALVRKAMIFYPFLAHRPDAPLIAAGTIGLSGTISVVANPNGGGTGVPLSSWSGSNTTSAGSMQTCHISEFLSTDSTYSTQTDSFGNTVTLCPSCTCPNQADLQLSNTSTEGIDILDIDGNAGANPDSTNFPDDVFQYVFGVPEGEYETLKNQAQILNDCSTLGPGSAGLYWVTGDCSIPAGTTVGSVESPVLLVVENNFFRMNSNSAFFGLVFSFAHGGGTIGVQLNGGPTLYGSMISNQNIDLGNGTYTARYDKTVLDNLARGGASAASSMAEVPGTWINYQPQ